VPRAILRNTARLNKKGKTMWRLFARASSFRRPASVAAAAAGLLCAVGAAGSAASDGQPSAYLAELERVLGGGRNGPGSASPSTTTQKQKKRAGKPAVDVAGINAAARAVRRRRLATGKVDLEEEDAEAEAPPSSPSPSPSPPAPGYTYRAERTAAPAPSADAAGSTLVDVRSKLDVASIDREVAVLAITRGAHPAVAEAVRASVEAAARADGAGFTFYAVTDETPEDVCSFLEKALSAEIPEPFVAAVSSSPSSEAAVPIVAVFDRAGKKRTKYIMPVEYSKGADASSSTPGAAEGEGQAGTPLPPLPLPPSYPPLSPLDADLLTAAPYPSDVADFLGAFAYGELKPTLLGSPRPPADADPFHPSLTTVVSSSWDDIVLDPRRDVLLEAYLTHCPMCMCLAPRLRMLAELASAHFPHVRVAAMNVDENDRPLDWMPGPAFPTLQLFSAGPPTLPYTKALGPACGNGVAGASAAVHLASPETFEGGHEGIAPHAHGAAKDTDTGGAGKGQPAPRPSPASARSARTGSPPCVPSVDFTHPTVPGKMALPSVSELLHWVAAHSSQPFDPALLRVPASAVRGSATKYADMLPPPPASAAAESPLVADAIVVGGAGAEAGEVSSATVPLTALAADMDAEARVIEYAIFDTFFFEHVLELAGKATGAVRNPGAAGGVGAGPLPDFATTAWRERHARLRGAVQQLRAAAIERSSYGTADAALDAMDACSAVVDGEGGLRAVARAFTVDQEDMKVVAEALPLAARLAAAERADAERRQLA
jgi:hypothetical protein